MSRLLHAAARGARVQTWAGVLGWRSTSLFGPWSYDDGDRIHPDDEHLAYGPISTALREMALTGEYEDGTIPYFSFEIEIEGKYWESTADQRRVFCLILAEFLADSGM